MASKYAVIAGNKKEAEAWASAASLEKSDWVYVTEPKQLKDATVVQVGNWYTADPEVLAAAAGVVEDEPEDKEKQQPSFK